MGRRSREAEWNYIRAEMINILQKHDQKFVKAGKKEVKSIIKSWYSSYRPIYYYGNKRKKSLYDAVEFTLSDMGVSVHFGSDGMTYYHGLLADYIYTNSFEEGYHGGARKGIDKLGFSHPEEGTPWYMRFYAEPGHVRWGFDRWSKQDGNDREIGAAIQTFSPKDKITERLPELWNDIESDTIKEFEKKIFPRIEKLRSGRW